MPRVDTALWREILEYLRHRHAAICRQWFQELEPLDLHNGLIRVRVGNPVQQKYLQSRCVEQFTEAAQSATGNLIAVRFVGDDAQPIAEPARPAVGLSNNGSLHAAPNPAQRQAAPPRPVVPAPLPAPTQRPSDPDLDQIVLSPDYSFDNFVTGPNNRLAYAAAVAVANSPGVAYNPLFIHGGVGLGKTHLLQAVCQRVLQENPHARICYLSCDAFVNQFLDCVQSGQMSDFRHRYRQVDLLLIDDIHFLTGKEQTQEEFFHTFNALYQSKKQIVLSSDSPPAEIPALEERLISRFQWGLVAQVTPPSYETRIAILRSKAQQRGATMPDDVISYIANRVDTNARELEGALTTIQGHAALQSRTIDLDLAREALGDPVYEPAAPQISLQQIIDAVTAFYNVKLSELQSKRRHKSIAEPRQVCMWLARKHTRFSLQEIGGYFGGRDHTTVMHAVKTVDSRVETEPAFGSGVTEIERRLMPGKG